MAQSKRQPLPAADKRRERSVLARGWEKVRAAWHGLAGGGDETDEAGRDAGLTARQQSKLRRTLAECVQELGGEVSARQRVARIGDLYLGLGDAGKRDFLKLLAAELGPSSRTIAAAIANYLGAGDEAGRRQQESALRQALRSPRIKVFTQFNALPDGVRFLVRLRADVLRLLRELPELAPLDEELFALLSSWFDVGFLSLQCITWASPAALLEKLIAYEAVHEIRSWNDLRNRLDSDRRLYAFFHPRMPDEPLIFVEVALMKKLADNVQRLLDESSPTTDPHQADTAIFYSISNTQAGLRGVSFGNFLIKRVVDDLRKDFPRLKTFATLSPIPQFRRWLEAQLAEHAEQAVVLAAGNGEPVLDLRTVLKTDKWIEDETLRARLEAPLLHLCANYLIHAREGDKPFDPVARFHLGNGARIERLNWLADTAPKGLKQSFGLMVNYLYDLDNIESNHEAFARGGEVIASSGVRRLLRRPKPSPGA
jgi:malonyl-CoA decarboxylase